MTKFANRTESTDFTGPTTTNRDIYEEEETDERSMCGEIYAAVESTESCEKPAEYFWSALALIAWLATCTAWWILA